MESIRRSYSLMTWRKRELLGNIRREILYKSGKEVSDFEFFLQIEPYLAHVLGADGFNEVKRKLTSADPTVVDIAPSRTVIRGVVFFDATHTICVDPAYAWYEHRQKDLWEPEPYSSDIFGGYDEKREMVKQLKLAFKNLVLPNKIEGQGPHLIRGERFHKERTIELIPADAIEWISQQQEESVPNFIVWRAFFHPQTWAELLTKLKTGGFLMTTGYGKVANDYDYELGEVVSGVDIANSPLPLNGNPQSIGLIPLTDLPEIYFYQKVEHKLADTLRYALEENK